MSGFYLMHRGWLENPVFGGARREPYDRRSAWVWLIEHAVFTTTTVLIGGMLVELKRGELSYSTRDLASRWGWSQTGVRRFCAAIEAAEMISCNSVSGVSRRRTAVEPPAHHGGSGPIIITICNYEKYQVESRASGIETGEPVAQRRLNAGSPNKEVERKEEEVREEDAPADAGAVPCLDVMGELISRCTVWLARTTGRTERSVRGLVVGWLKAYGDGAVVEVFTEASRSPPFEPISWIEARLKRRGEKSNGRGSAEHDRAVDILGNAGFDYDERQGRSGPAQTPH